MLGIKESGELATFFGRFASVSASVMEDGKVKWLELTQFLNIIPTIKPAYEGIAEVPKEFADLDENERDTLKITFANSLDLLKDDIEEVWEEGFDLAMRNTQFIAKVAKIRRDKRATA